MDEAVEEGYNYFLILTWNMIGDKTAYIVCMRRSAISYVRKKFV